MRLGKAIKLAENTSPDAEHYSGCAVSLLTLEAQEPPLPEGRTVGAEHHDAFPAVINSQHGHAGGGDCSRDHPPDPELQADRWGSDLCFSSKPASGRYDPGQPPGPIVQHFIGRADVLPPLKERGECEKESKTLRWRCFREKQEDVHAQSSLHATHLYKPFMDSLHHFYMRGRNLPLLTICLPKLLTVAVASRGAARGNQSSRQRETRGAS